MPQRKKKKKKKIGVSLPTSKTSVASVPKDYIMAFYGPPGVGKTTFVENLAERVLFLSTDRGTRFFSALRQEFNSYKELNQVLTALEQPGVAENYDIVCFDHIDDVVNMIEDHTCDELGVDGLGDAGYGKGWKNYKKGIWNVVQRVLKLNLGVIFISHETLKTVTTKVIETTRTMPDMNKSAWKTIIPKCDIVGYCGFRLVKSKGKKIQMRTLETTPREDLYAKDRTNRSTPEDGKVEKLDGKLFIQTFGKGVSKHGKKKKVSRKKISRK